MACEWVHVRVKDHILLLLWEGQWELAQRKQMRMQVTCSCLEANGYREATKVLRSSEVVGGWVTEGTLQVGWALKVPQLMDHQKQDVYLGLASGTYTSIRK